MQVSVDLIAKIQSGAVSVERLKTVIDQSLNQISTLCDDANDLDGEERERAGIYQALMRHSRELPASEFKARLQRLVIDRCYYADWHCMRVDIS